MLWRSALLLVLLTARAVAGGVATFYVGTYTDHSESQGIYVGTIDTVTGRLGALKLAATEKNPNFLAISPDHQFLFAALSSAVESFKIQADSTLKPISTEPVAESDLCHVAVDRTGHVVFVANYGGGAIDSFPVDDDGKIGLLAASRGFSGSGPNPHRQKKPFAHEVVVDPHNTYVYGCDLGTDSIWSFKLGPGAMLTATNPPAAKGPPGSGTRHMVFNHDGSRAYVVGEMGMNTSVFSCNKDTGGLTLLDTESNVWPGDPASGGTAAEIVLHPSGKWLYVSNRNPEHDSISMFAVNAQGGIRLMQSVPSPVKCPRSIAVDPTGHWVIAAGQNDNTIAVLRIDPATGHLSVTDTSATVGSPVCVLFVPDEMLGLLH